VGHTNLCPFATALRLVPSLPYPHRLFSGGRDRRLSRARDDAAQARKEQARLAEGLDRALNDKAGVEERLRQQGVAAKAEGRRLEQLQEKVGRPVSSAGGQHPERME